MARRSGAPRTKPLSPSFPRPIFRAGSQLTERLKVATMMGKSRDLLNSYVGSTLGKIELLYLRVL